MKLGFLYGRWSTQFHGGFDFRSLFEGGRGLTGSESSLMMVAKTLSELGHEVFLCCQATHFVEFPPALAGVRIIPLSDSHDFPELPTDCDAYISWNEPDLLRMVPKTALRVLDHQLNDFGFCYEGWQKAVDQFVFCSRAQADNLVALSNNNIDMTKVTYMPNPIDLTFFEGPEKTRRPGSIVFSSSPDRGLHRILEIFPEIRKQVPEANLNIYYEWTKVRTKTVNKSTLSGLRFRYMDSLIEKLGMNGENGVFFRGNLPNRQLISDLKESMVFAYTCDPMRFTEGFSVGTLDACAAGVYPILSGIDALPEIYGDVAEIIDGNPCVTRDKWVAAIVKALTDPEHRQARSRTVKSFAQGFSRQIIGERWELLLQHAIDQKAQKIRNA